MSNDYVCGIVEEMWSRSTANGQFWSIKINGESFGFGKYPPKFGEGSEVEFDIRWNGEYPNVDWDTWNILNQVGEGPSQQRDGGGRGNGRSQGGNGRQGGSGQRSQGGGQRQGGRGGPRQNQGTNGGNGSGRSQGSGGSGRQGGSGRSSGGSSGGGISKDDYWSRKEERDIVVQQHIQYQASRNAAIAALESMLRVEAVKLPAKQADKYDAYLALLDTLTEQFNQQTTDLGSGGGSQRGGRDDEDNPDADDFPDDNMPEYQGDN